MWFNLIPPKIPNSPFSSLQVLLQDKTNTSRSFRRTCHNHLTKFGVTEGAWGTIIRNYNFHNPSYAVLYYYLQSTKRNSFVCWFPSIFCPRNAHFQVIQHTWVPLCMPGTSFLSMIKNILIETSVLLVVYSSQVLMI